MPDLYDNINAGHTDGQTWFIADGTRYSEPSHGPAPHYRGGLTIFDLEEGDSVIVPRTPDLGYRLAVVEKVEASMKAGYAYFIERDTGQIFHGFAGRIVQG